MKALKKDIESILKSLDALTTKVEKLKAGIQKLDAPAPKKAVAKKTPARTTDFDTVVNFIRRSREGVTIAKVKEKTGFDTQKIANITFKAKKQGKIQSGGRGVYVKA
ncbi:hypothetical protein ACFL0Q_08550 [Thermodesulfobacteriota bacterium]